MHPGSFPDFIAAHMPDLEPQLITAISELYIEWDAAKGMYELSVILARAEAERKEHEQKRRARTHNR